MESRLAALTMKSPRDGDESHQFYVAPCPLAPRDVTLSGLLEESETLLRNSYGTLERDDCVLPPDLKQCVMKSVQVHITAMVQTWPGRVKGHAFEQPQPKLNPLHREAAQVNAFSLALKFALLGQLTQAERAALDNYFPPAPPSCTSRTVTVTGVGCLLLGLAAAVGGGIARALVDDGSEQHTVATAVEFGGVASLVFGLGVSATQCLSRYCKSTPTADDSAVEKYSEERRLLGAVQDCMREKARDTTFVTVDFM